MSQSEIGDEAPAVAAQMSSHEPHLAPDWYLQSLVELTNGTDLSLPVTLYLKGLVLSGSLVSGHKYFEGLAGQLAEFMGDGPEVGTIVKELTSAGETYLTEKDEQWQTVYIHLREAKVFEPGKQGMPADGVWWRGRLASVDAFHFGKLITK